MEPERRELDLDVELALIEAERRALRVLSPMARAVIISLKSLRAGAKTAEEVKSECTALGFLCTNIRRALAYLEECNLVKNVSGKYELTEHGREVADAIYNIAVEIRDFAYNVVRGAYTDMDVYTHMATPFASLVGVVDAYMSDSASLDLALVLHAYVSVLSASVLATLTKLRPDFGKVVEKLEETFMQGGELQES